MESSLTNGGLVTSSLGEDCVLTVSAGLDAASGLLGAKATHSPSPACRKQKKKGQSGLPPHEIRYFISCAGFAKRNEQHRLINDQLTQTEVVFRLSLPKDTCTGAL